MVLTQKYILNNLRRLHYKLRINLLYSVGTEDSQIQDAHVLLVSVKLPYTRMMENWLFKLVRNAKLLSTSNQNRLSASYDFSLKWFWPQVDE